MQTVEQNAEETKLRVEILRTKASILRLRAEQLELRADNLSDPRGFGKMHRSATYGIDVQQDQVFVSGPSNG